MRRAHITEEERLLISVEEAAELLSLSRGTAYKLASEGSLPVVKIGRSVRVRKADLPAWLERHAVGR